MSTSLNAWSVVGAVKTAASKQSSMRLPEHFDDKAVRGFVRQGVEPISAVRFGPTARDGRRVNHDYTDREHAAIVAALITRYGGKSAPKAPKVKRAPRPRQTAAAAPTTAE